ncbi:hypothetical protein SEA_EYRE_74 [Gordonia phage Eyre]|uniref:Uncharacterized protein n=1 Tax=Gordonia phage Eyre TaxID=1887646 RepID=A0A1B3B027_9CAUD|nr:hypothetical protein BIZ73_gp74 [Gordonia phage Eyre]AOE44354.1 hypothetical protein SEA_EYRE_74 [Gordonia phage Eyre]
MPSVRWHRVPARSADRPPANRDPLRRPEAAQNGAYQQRSRTAETQSASVTLRTSTAVT